MRIFLGFVFFFWLAIIAGIVQDDMASRVAPTDDPSQGDKVTVVFWHAMGGPLGAVMDDLINRFNASQQKYHIKGVPMGSYDTLAKKILASLVAGEAPDISQNYETLTKKFIKHNKIVCLDDLIGSDPTNIKDDIIPVLLRNNTFNGKLYSFPFNKSVPVLYYNKDLFRKAGLDPDRPPETLTELASYSHHIANFFPKDQQG